MDLKQPAQELSFFIQKEFSFLSGLFSYLFAPREAHAFLRQIKPTLLKTLQKFKYRKYQRELLYQAFVEGLLRWKNLRKNFSRPPFGSLEDFLLFYFREKGGFSITYLSGIFRKSEQTLRLRLWKTRFSLLQEPFLLPKAAENGHYCTLNLEIFEDYPGLQNSLVYENVQNCHFCERFHHAKINALQVFSATPAPHAAITVENHQAEPQEMKPRPFTIKSWKASPWYWKLLLEGMLTTCLISGTLLSIPKIKAFLDLWSEKRIEFYQAPEMVLQANAVLEEKSNDQEEKPNPFLEEILDDAVEEQVKAHHRETEFPGKDKPASDKTYRYMISADSLAVYQDRIKALIQEFKVTSENGFQTIMEEVPGGIIFDGYLSIGDHARFEQQLTQIPQLRIIVTRNREKIISGRTHIKIWIQQNH